MCFWYLRICFLVKKGDLGIVKNYRGITRWSIVVTFYSALLRNCIAPKNEKILWKNQNGFQKNQSWGSQVLAFRLFLGGIRAKSLEATFLFVEYPKSFDSIHREKMEQILLAHGLPEETVAAIILQYKTTKVKVCSAGGGTDYVYFVGGLLKRYPIPLNHLPRLFAYNVYRFNERKRFQAGKRKKQKKLRRHNYGRRLCWWHNASGRNPAS